ncbi:MAG: prepilin-type N-terminal cleavage/methylation domain-containing protein [Nitrospinae bacterium]|nr:prepilin-type N-terminal cleavage/methylation domain-containing protein [Nitrospinota bacterium]
MLLINWRDRGFALIELLIAVAITSILLTALYAAFFSIYRVTEAVEDKMERHLDTGSFLDQFVKEVNSAYFKTTNSMTIFTGEKKGLTSFLSFTAFTRPVLKEGSPSSDLMSVSYFVEEENGVGTLYRETRNPYGEEKSKLEVLKGIKGFEVGFFNGKDWASAWDASLEKRLPEAVRAAVITDEGKEIAAIAVPRMK